MLARQQRAELEADIARIIEQTEDEADLEVVVQGNEARIRTTGGGEIVLVREAGEWHVVDVR